MEHYDPNRARVVAAAGTFLPPDYQVKRAEEDYRLITSGKLPRYENPCADCYAGERKSPNRV